MQREQPEPTPRADGGRTVASVMRPAVTMVETRGHLAAAAYVMNHADQSALVVVDQADRPVAIITEADLLRAVAHGADTGQAYVEDWMSHNPPTVHPSNTITEAARIMLDSGSRHLPVVSDGRVVGIVAIGDIVPALVRSVRLASAVVFVSDLARSLSFYQPLLRYTIAASDADVALLAGPDGSQLYLHQVSDDATHRSNGLGVQWVAWTAGGDEDLDRCTEMLKARGAYVGRHVMESINIVEGRDPDGLPVLITYPGPDLAPRHLIDARISQP
jgi:CBS domain-containing protein